jgi:superfamily II DNA/RNA helicase
VLVATDIAARGIHVDNIELVVHVDPPAEHKAYLHRSGRTARAGAEGVVATLMLPEQTDDVRKLARAAGIAPVTTTVTTGHPLLASLATAAVSGSTTSEIAQPSKPRTAEPRTSEPRTGQPRTNRNRNRRRRGPRADTATR